MNWNTISKKFGNGTATPSEACELAMHCGANITICAKNPAGLPTLFFRADPFADQDDLDCLGFTARLQQAMNAKSELCLVCLDDSTLSDCELSTLWNRVDPATVYMMHPINGVRCFYGTQKAAELLNTVAIDQGNADDEWEERRGEAAKGE